MKDKLNFIWNKIKPHVKILCVSATIGFVVLGIVMQYAIAVQSDISKKVIRLHVLANSDTYADQQLKLAVRDAVIDYLSGKLPDGGDVEATKTAIENEFENIRDIAKIEIIKNGYDYPVNVELGNYRFPTKYYENIRFPAGKYDALKITIGAGEGKNWWCVLYPNLCLNGNTGYMDDKNKEKLQSVMSEDEFTLITDTQTPSVQIKFRVVELFAK